VESYGSELVVVVALKSKGIARSRFDRPRAGRWAGRRIDRDEARSSSREGRASGGGGTEVEQRIADLFKSLAVGLTRVEPRKHTRFSLFNRGRAASRGETGRRDADRSSGDSLGK